MERLRGMIIDVRRLREENKRAAEGGQHGRWVDAAYCACRERALLDAYQAVTGEKFNANDGLKRSEATSP